MQLQAPTLAQIEAARGRIAGRAIRTPLIRLPDRGGDNEIWLKLETLQPVGSFKLRGAGNCILSAPREQLANGVYTASAGNMAQGVAWMARELGLPAKVFVPDQAPDAKVNAIRALGGTVEKITFDDWWSIMIANGRAGQAGCFVHPVCDTEVMACEVENAAPLAAALAAGQPTPIDYRRSFVDGIGSGAVLPAMWPVVNALLTRSIVVPLPQIEAALRQMINRLHIIAEGAGATALAAAQNTGLTGKKIVAIISGSGINFTEVTRIMAAGA